MGIYNFPVHVGCRELVLSLSRMHLALNILRRHFSHFFCSVNTIWVSFPTAVRKTLQRKQLKGEGFPLSPQLTVQLITVGWPVSLKRLSRRVYKLEAERENDAALRSLLPVV